MLGIARRQRSALYRPLSTLASNPDIKVFPSTSSPNTFILTYLENEPPSQKLAIGTCTENPPTPRSFTDNAHFTSILNDVLAKHARDDAQLRSQAQALASPGGSTLGSGGGGFSGGSPRNSKAASAASAQEGASGQGGAGGGGVGGWVHLSDSRNPPDFGRIAWPEDIFGSVEVDHAGAIVGNFQPSGTYRILTNEGILGLSPFLQQKLIERLKEEASRESGA